ncbi:DNA mismatch repair protein MutS [Dinghuibacter silviterrae]|uniref:DNA mismatch repair protein MutS n=2 Tax=Dinghuibacter silviterrae TaxID=1539049 RepID=A0A4R8DUI6_9BACT|nr:DNA mismatch repair protein MutS [Dinghuibacter silviterrae]
MQQHRAIKARFPDAILLFRVGDFYETFGEDAIVASKVLGITLTKRNNGAAASAELAGFPHHALDTYLHKLVKAGHRVAVCDQLEDPKTVKGIVKRGVTEMVTPGVATNDKLLEGGSNNFLAGFHADGGRVGLAFLDISTGEFFVTEGDADYADRLLQSLRPAEVVFRKDLQRSFKETFGDRFYTYPLDAWIFEEQYARESLARHFETRGLKGFGIDDMPLAIISAGAVLHYLRETEHPHLGHLVSIQRIAPDGHLWMDKFTIRNLELLGSNVEGGHHLLATLNNTVSPMGARLLRRWTVMPLKDKASIDRRLDLVEYLVRDTDVRKTFREAIASCGDIERLVSKLPARKINPREVLQLCAGLGAVGRVREAKLGAGGDPYLAELCAGLDPSPALRDRITRALVDHPSVQLGKGPVIREGVDAALDDLRGIAGAGKEYLLRLQQQESEATGISSLKVSFNNVFGYYLEVTNAHKGKVPPTWIRKQTLTGAERYITPELKEYEEKIMGAEEKILALETRLYDELLEHLQGFIAPLQRNGHLLAILDVLAGFAENALRYHYKKPEVHEGTELDIREGRHPVMERHLPPGESYIANDLLLDPTTQQVIILTGPNMSGKSALLRQTALITLMAHLGSFVPATAARVPLTDKIFTRVGASDNLSGGESTFMVEMNETASILNNLTARSLVLLDEIGRGTATYDGISIAWSIVEYLQRHPGRPKTFFATHYHELNELEERLEGVRNFHITHKEVGQKVIFLRKLAPGGSTHSFGIHVAKMAGMPPSLLERAEELLAEMEGKHLGTPVDMPGRKNGTPQLQLSIFDAHSETFAEIRRVLNAVDINNLTPVEALLKLSEIKNLLK